MPIYPSPAEQQVIPTEIEGQPTLQILEQNKRLSESLLWKILENYYDEAGMAAWEHVPFYITNNLVIAESYAELTCALLRDLLPTLDMQEPFYILELAAGSGCFSYYYLDRLLGKLAYCAELSALKLCYVMTDFTGSNFSNWSDHEKFSVWKTAGLLDFAIFRPETDNTMMLLNQRITLSSETIKNPVLAIANYFFDSIRQDLFFVRDGKLQEAKITFFRELNGICPEDPLKLKQLKTFEQFQDVSTRHYASPKINSVLNQYAEQMESAPFIFPIGALQVIENLKRLSNERLALLSSDKGFTSTQFMSTQEKITYTPHGEAFSFNVNYHAIQQFFQNEQGSFFATPDPAFMTTLGLSFPPDDSHGFLQTQYYFQEKLIKTNPVLNYIYSFPLMDPTREMDVNEAFNSCCAFMEMNYHDPRTLYACSGKLMLILKQLDSARIEKLLLHLEAIAGNIYPVAQKPDIWVVLGIFYFYLENYDRSLKALAHSLDIYGKTDVALYYTAMTYEAMQQKTLALAHFTEVLMLNPICDLSQKAILRLENNLPKSNLTTAANERYALDYFLKAIAKDVLATINAPLKLAKKIGTNTLQDRAA